jgi:PKD repeat protein
MYSVLSFTQGIDCNNSEPFCSDNGQYTFPASTNVPDMGTVGCLYTTPNPAWYWMQVDQPGNIDINMQSGGDVDFIAWGPFPSLAAGCASDPIGNNNPGVDCSYSTAAQETANIPNAQTGEVYILLITNYANIVTNITFSQTAGAGTTDCGIIAPPIANNGPLCEGETLLLTVNNPTPGATYNWTGPSGYTSNQMNNTIANVTNNNEGVYSMTITLGGSTSNPVTTTVVINDKPIVTATANLPEICNGQSSTLTAVGASTYLWDDGSVANPYSVSPTTNTTYTVIGTSIDGCKDTTTVNIIVNPNPNLIITVNNLSCFQSNDGIATATITNGTSPYTYSWSSLTNVQSNLQAGNYNLIVTDDNNCTVTQNYVVTEPVLLQILNTSTFTNVTCFGLNNGNITVNAIGGTGGLQYSWSDVTNVTTSTRNNLSTNNYWVTVTDVNSCSVSTMFTITEPSELLTTTSPNISICEGTNTTIQGQGIGGVPPYVYYWNNVISSQNIIVTPLTTTNYEFYIRDANNCISNISNVLVTVSPKIIIDSIILNHNSCYESCDGSAEIIVHGGLLPLTYIWTSPTNISTDLCEGIYPFSIVDNIGCSIQSNFIITQPPQLLYLLSTTDADCFGYLGEASILVYGGTPNYTYTWSNAIDETSSEFLSGTYGVTVDDANDCRITATFDISEPTALYVLPIGDRTICQGQSTMLGTQVTGGMPHYDYHWSSSEGIYNSNQYYVNPTQTTTYTLVVTDSHGCSSTPIYSTVYVNPNLVINNLVTSEDTICRGDISRIYADVDGGNGGPYSLSLSDGSIVTSPISVSPDSTDMIYVYLNDMCGTPTVVDSILITVIQKPSNLFAADKVNGCPPLTINFTETSPDMEGTTYLWQLGDDWFSVYKNTAHIYYESGFYDVNLTVTDRFGCVNMMSIDNMIHVYDVPTSNFDTDREFASFLSPEIEFINYSSNYFNSFWYFGDGDSSIFRNPRHIYDDIGEYEVMLVTESYYGCTDTIVKPILIQTEFTFYVPTAFTPDFDGFNDCFKACGVGIDKDKFSMTVYDRWGIVVFQTDEFVSEDDCYACGTFSWNGTKYNMNDELLPNDVYAWYCEYYDFNGVKYEKSGIVNLIR